MATYQISRIQLRRGKANEGTGLPQLASGEMAWAIDTQELYIGNGSVSEGAPFVGNTRILTQRDIASSGGILNLLQHTYKKNDPSISTGTSASTPVVRSIQDRLDDFVSVLDFASATELQTGDYFSIFQRAINQLFLNPTSKASGTGPDSTRRRVALFIPAGEYQFSSTLLIPSFATIIGVGVDKTTLIYTGTGSAIRFVNDSSTADNPDPAVSTNVNQAKYITIKQLTVTTTASAEAIQLNSVKNSRFTDMSIVGNWDTTFNNSIGIKLTAVSTVVTCEGNCFENVTFTGFKYPVYSDHDIKNNFFHRCTFYKSRSAVQLGYATNGSLGQQVGPTGTSVDSCVFIGIYQNAMYVRRGKFNRIHNCRFTNVGNSSTSELESTNTVTYPQVYFYSKDNEASNNISDRDIVLESTQTYKYLPSIAGLGVKFTSSTSKSITLNQYNLTSFAFRLPVSCDSTGTPSGTASFLIPYSVSSGIFNYSRNGVLEITANISGSIATASSVVNMADEFTFAGDSANVSNLSFTAKLFDASGAEFTGVAGQVPASIVVQYNNNQNSDPLTLTYSVCGEF